MIENLVEKFVLKDWTLQVVSRGGFHVGNGINWKGQVFSKMRNHTLTNRMTVCFQVVSLIVFLCDNTFVDVESIT